MEDRERENLFSIETKQPYKQKPWFLLNEESQMSF